jgi:hypothetical protein
MLNIGLRVMPRMFFAAPNDMGGTGFKSRDSFDFLKMKANAFPLSYSQKDRPEMAAGFRINILPGQPRITVDDVVGLFQQGVISPALDASKIKIDRFSGDFFLRNVMHCSDPNLKSWYFTLSSRSFNSTEHLVEGCIEISS